MPGELTQESDNMDKGFDDMDDSSPFLAEPTYDPQHGGWLTKEMRVHLKILQTGTANQVDLHQDNPSLLNADRRTPTVVPQPPEELSGGWTAGEILVDDVPKMKMDDPLPAPKYSSNAAIQCTLLVDPTEQVPVEWPGVAGTGIQQQEAGIGVCDAPMENASYKGDEGSMAPSSKDPKDLAPLTESDWEMGELAQSCHLVRLTRPIVWSQRKWMPSPEK